MKKRQSKAEKPTKQAFKQPSKQPPKLHAFDFNFILGQDDSGQQLAKLTSIIQFKKQKVRDLAINSDLVFQDIGKDTVIKFDFVTQEGRQKQAIQYFENGLDRQNRREYDPNYSPLQNWFIRPVHSGKLQLFQSKRIDGKKGVTLLYKIYTSEQGEDTGQLSQIIHQKIQPSQINHPNLHMDIVIKGRVQNFKKNIISMRWDHVHTHFYSDQLHVKDFLGFFELMDFFGLEGEAVSEITNNPIYKLLLNSQQIQGSLKMSSLSRMLYLYKIGSQNKYSQRQLKDTPEVIKGLFKSELRITIILQSVYGLVATINYQSEAVLVRILSGLRKYSSLID